MLKFIFLLIFSLFPHHYLYNFTSSLRSPEAAKEFPHQRGITIVQAVFHSRRPCKILRELSFFFRKSSLPEPYVRRLDHPFLFQGDSPKRKPGKIELPSFQRLPSAHLPENVQGLPCARPVPSSDTSSRPHSPLRSAKNLLRPHMSKLQFGQGEYVRRRPVSLRGPTMTTLPFSGSPSKSRSSDPKNSGFP